MNWITIKLMQYQLKKAKRQYNNEKHDIIKRAKADVMKTYETAIMFIEASST
jgi:hypothetical protein